MNLFEFEGKQLFAHYGIPIPRSEILFSRMQAPTMAYPYVLKAQVPVGGRGKVGGIRVCASQGELEENTAQMWDMSIKGHRPAGLLCEQCVKPEEELYVSITLQNVQRPTLIISRAGGMEIEEVARTAPEKICKVQINPFTGLKNYQRQYILDFIGMENRKELAQVLQKLERAFFDMEAVLCEINPLGLLDGKLIAMDAKVVLDDDSGKCAPIIQELTTQRERLSGWQPPEKDQTTITYVPMEKGGVGLISDGAGTGMLTLDLVHDAGGKVRSFCELGGVTNAEVMYRAMQLTLESGLPIKSVLIVLIGGFNRMDDMALGITRYLAEHPADVPVFTRMCGTMERAGKQIMAQAGLGTYDSLIETVAAAAAREVE